jgi:hypothetical protein
VGAGVIVGAERVTFWRALAMAMTAEAGRYSEHVREPSLAKLRHVTDPTRWDARWSILISFVSPPGPYSQKDVFGSG